MLCVLKKGEQRFSDTVFINHHQKGRYMTNASLFGATNNTVFTRTAAGVAAMARTSNIALLLMLYHVFSTAEMPEEPLCTEVTNFFFLRYGTV